MNESQPETASINLITAANAELMESLGGVTLLDLNKEQGLVDLQFECLRRFCHSGGRIAQGGYVTAWMDAAMAHAVILCSDRQHNVASLDISVRFMRPVGPGMVVARGRIVRKGKRVVFLDAQLMDAAGDCVATATSSGMLISMPS